MHTGHWKESKLYSWFTLDVIVITASEIIFSTCDQIKKIILIEATGTVHSCNELLIQFGVKESVRNLLVHDTQIFHSHKITLQSRNFRMTIIVDQV